MTCTGGQIGGNYMLRTGDLAITIRDGKDRPYYSGMAWNVRKVVTVTNVNTIDSFYYG